MLRVLLERWRQGHRTMPLTGTWSALPERYRGRPVLPTDACPPACTACVDACPTEALGLEGRHPVLDLGRCLFCPACVEACPLARLGFSRDPRLAVSRVQDLMLRPDHAPVLAERLDADMRRLFGRSLRLRQVSAGGCNACEADANVLNTVGFDLARTGIQFVASPRHADGLLITGPVTENMREALWKTYQATPEPRLVIAVGACAISGGPYRGHPEVLDGASGLLPVDLFVPGCPPHPLTLLDGLLRWLGQLEAVPTP